MKKTFPALLFLNYFSTGIIVPILSLLLINKSCSLAQIAILMGIYSLTVFILELPTGVLSDMFGRKKIFMISCGLNIVASFSMLFLSGFALLIPAVIVMGAGRAFSTGSLDALMIDDFIENNGKEGLAKATTALSIAETAGISAGTILGGFLPGLSEKVMFLGVYDLNLIVRCIIYIAIIILTSVLVKEIAAHKKEHISLKNHLVTGFKFIKSSPVILLLSASVILSGFFIAPVEAYWQPAYTALLPSKDLLFTVGLVSFGCFAFAALGSIFTERLVLRSEKHLYIKFTAARLLLFAAFIVFSAQRSAPVFAGTFLLVYFIFSGSNVIESTILNLHIPSSLRSSMLSFISLLFQAGCMLSPLVSTFAVSKTGINNLWLYIGIALFVSAAVIGVLLNRFRKTNQESPSN